MMKYSGVSYFFWECIILRQPIQQKNLCWDDCTLGRVHHFHFTPYWLNQSIGRRYLLQVLQVPKFIDDLSKVKCPRNRWITCSKYMYTCNYLLRSLASKEIQGCQKEQVAAVLWLLLGFYATATSRKWLKASRQTSEKLELVNRTNGCRVMVI